MECLPWPRMILGVLSGSKASHTVPPGCLRLGQDYAASACMLSHSGPPSVLGKTRATVAIEQGAAQGLSRTHQAP